MTDASAVEAVELLPCPFCGGDRARTIDIRDGRKVACICGACGRPEFQGPLYRPDAETRAIAAWNTRAAMPAASEGEGEGKRQLAEALARYLNRDAFDGRLKKRRDAEVANRARQSAKKQARAAIRFFSMPENYRRLSDTKDFQEANPASSDQANLAADLVEALAKAQDSVFVVGEPGDYAANQDLLTRARQIGEQG